MEEFNPMKINQYSIEQLIEYLNNGYTLEEFKQCGLNYLKREQLELRFEDDIWVKLCQDPTSRAEDYEDYINQYPNGKHVDDAHHKVEELRKVVATDEADWNMCVRQDTLEDYEYYLKKHPQGAHAQEAQAIIDRIVFILREKKQSLLADMRAEPWKYTFETMRLLLNGADEGTIQALKDGHVPGLELATDFILNRLKITINDLHAYGVVPQVVTKTDVCAEDFNMPATKIGDMGMFPNNRTDVYFLGVPRSGKSSVLSGMIYHLWKTGRAGYEPHIVNGIDPCGGYYRGLIEALGNKKPPVSTDFDTVSFMKLNIRNGDRTNDVTIVELSGEAFKSIAEAMNDISSKEVWEQLGATRCLQSPNRKCLFFVLDYSIISGRRNAQERDTAFNQSLTLESALHVLSHDGPNPKDDTRDCTMSKVDSVAVIMTKSDLMENATSRAQRTEIAQEYIYNNFRNFMNQLYEICKKYGINRAGNYLPYILTFSLGNFYVGNTVVFDSTDTDQIIQFISQVTPTRRPRRFNPFG